MTKLEADMQSPAGAMFRHVHQIHAALEAGFHVTLDDVTAEEFQSLQTLRSEIDKWHDSKQRSGGSDSRLPHFPRSA